MKVGVIQPLRCELGTAREIVNGVADQMRREMYHNIGLADLLSPRINA